MWLLGSESIKSSGLDEVKRGLLGLLGVLDWLSDR